MKKISPIQHVTSLAISGTEEEITSAIEVLRAALRSRFPKEKRPLLEVAGKAGA